MHCHSNSLLGRGNYSCISTLLHLFKKFLFSSFLVSIFVFNSLDTHGQTIVVLEDISARVTQESLPPIGMTIFPNPASDKLVTNVSGAEQIQLIQLFSLAGNQVAHIRPFSISHSYKLNVHTFPAGLYILRLHTERGIVSQKFTIMH